MKTKTCDSFLCTKRVNAKYRYCYDCAKSKGHIKGEPSLGSEIVACLVALMIIYYVFG